jgi:hypothetical protein
MDSPLDTRQPTLKEPTNMDSPQAQQQQTPWGTTAMASLQVTLPLTHKGATAMGHLQAAQTSHTPMESPWAQQTRVQHRVTTTAMHIASRLLNPQAAPTTTASQPIQRETTVTPLADQLDTQETTATR